MKTLHSFRCLWLGQTFANMGDVLFIIGLMPLIYLHTGSALLMALVPFITTFSRFISALAAPILFRTFPLKTILVWSQLLKTLLIIVLIIFTLTLIQSTTFFWLLYLIVSLLGFLDGWASPASRALLPKLVPKEKLVQANSWLESVSLFIEIAMWPIGGILVALFTSSFLFLFTFFLYLVATILLFLLTVEKSTLTIKEKQSLFSDASRGWVYILRNQHVFVLTLSSMLLSITNIAWISSIIYIYVHQVLKVTEEWWGYLNALLVVGLLIGSLLTMALPRLIEKKMRKLILLSLLFIFVSTLSLAFIAAPVLALLSALIYGFASQLFAIIQITYMQKVVDEQQLPYVYAAQDAGALLAFSIAVLVFNTLADMIQIEFVMVLASIFAFIALLTTYFYRKQLHSLS